MAYSIPLGKSAPFLDEGGTPIAEGTTDVSIADTSIVALSVVGGVIHLYAGTIGATDVTVTKGAAVVTHTVSVVASSFDWSLGAPV